MSRRSALPPPPTPRDANANASFSSLTHVVENRLLLHQLPLELVQFVMGSKHASLFASASRKGRIHGDDVERLSRGQPARQKGRGSRAVPHRLNEEERGEFERSERRGYLRLEGTGYRRERKGSPLANSWRQRNDSRAKPTLVMMKATGRDLKGGRDVTDTVCVDWSTMREPGNANLRKAIEESSRLIAGEEGMKEVFWDDGAGDEVGFIADYGGESVSTIMYGAYVMRRF